MRLEKRVEEVVKVVEEFMKVREMKCEGDVKCLIHKLVVVKEFYRTVDKLLHGLAFAYLQDISRVQIEELIEELINARIITRHDWERAVAHEIAYIRRINADRSRVLKMPVPVREDEEAESSR
jgi:hypothetical protein